MLEDGQIYVMLQNARQILNTVKRSSVDIISSTEEYPECEGAKSKEEVLNCLWSEVSENLKKRNQSDTADTLQNLRKVDLLDLFLTAFAESYQFLIYAQKTLSHAASEYDLRRLRLGIGITVLATIATLVACATPVRNANPVLLWKYSLALFYGFMMFASSYVEEEQQFWYWLASSWCGWLFWKG